MRRTALALVALATTALVGAAPASAASGTGSGGWTPAPSAPWDTAAGARCDFPVHGEPVVDEVVSRVVERNEDGSTKSAVYKGDLVIRVTNTDTAASYDADASGSALITYKADGSQHWSVVGPVFVGFRENGGNVARGLYIIDGLYTLDISATGYKTVNMAYGSQDDICEHID